jgi:flagellar hook-basal body complex protein FliE
MSARGAIQPDPSSDITSQLRSFGESFASTLQQAETMATASMTSDVDPHSLVQALAQSELAVETAVTVRDKVVQAYQEILRMQV